MRGICVELIERLERLGLAVTPPEADRRSDRRDVAQMVALGRVRLHLAPEAAARSSMPRPSIPTASSASSNDMVAEAKVNLRLHCWFSRAIVEDGAIKGVICESKEGRQAILGKIVVDATGDLDVAASAGAPFIEGAYIVTTVFRLGGVDIEEAERFEYEEPEAFKAIDREAKRIIGGSWDNWWLKTPLPGVVWCNCPHMARLRRPQGRRPDARRIRGPQAHRRAGRLPARQDAGLPRLLCRRRGAADSASARRACSKGDYVVTKEDVTRAPALRRQRGARPRLLHALSLAAAARRRRACSSPAGTIRRPRRRSSMSREIPPCMAMGEAAGVAAALALEARRGAATGRCRQAAEAAARPGRRSGRRAGRQRHRAEGRGMSTDANAAARRHAGDRLHAGHAGPVRDADAGRLRRRRDQDRAAGRRRPVAHLDRPTIRTGSTIRCSAASTATSARSRSTCAARRARRSCYDLVKTADVVVNNFRAGVMDRMGFGYEALPQDQPAHHLRLRLGLRPERAAVAQGRPGHARPGDDRRDGAQARSDACRPSIYATALADYSRRHASRAGHPAGAAAAREDRRAASRSRSRSTIPCSPCRCRKRRCGCMRKRELNWGALPLTGVFETTDGALVIVGAFKANPLQDICRALGLPDLSADPRLRHLRQARSRTRPSCSACSAAGSRPTRRRTGSPRLEEQDLLCAPVQSLAEALADPSRRPSTAWWCRSTPTAAAATSRCSWSARRSPWRPRRSACAMRRRRSASTTPRSWASWAMRRTASTPCARPSAVVTIRFDVDDHVARVTIDRPDRMNAVDEAPEAELMRIWADHRAATTTCAASC